MGSIRINARLDEQSRQDLDYIREVTGQAVTDIVKRALAAYSDQLRHRTKTGEKMHAILASDFVGCAEGPENLSTDYKDFLHQGLKEKHDTDPYRGLVLQNQHLNDIGPPGGLAVALGGNHDIPAVQQ